jgi:Ala-tRNA(Pro) deacylase
MAIAGRVKWFLDNNQVKYDLVHHVHSSSSLDSARRARVPSDHLAKCVVLEDERGYLMVVLPASHRIELGEIRDRLGRKLELAGELELAQLFTDCEVGAVPPLGAAYGIPCVIDESLTEEHDVYFEAGDHEDLVHMAGEDFAALTAGLPHCAFSRHL